MSAFFFVLAFLIVALFVYMGRYSSRVLAEQSRFIAMPPEAAYERVADLAQWQAWNPWLEHAPAGTRAEVDGILLAWDVANVGRGRVRQVAQTPSRALRQRLEFDLPFACKGRSDWRFEPAPGGTQVTWRFKGRVAFTLRAFAATVQGATALDLRFGLDRLAAALEGRSPDYTLTYAGLQDQPERLCAQASYRGPLDTLAAELPPRIADVRAKLASAGLPAEGTAVVHYLKTQLKLRIVDCRVGVELPADAALPAVRPQGRAAPSPPPGGGKETRGGPSFPCELTLHEQPAHPAYLLRFDGPPEALELAWYQAMQRLRVEQRQPDPRLPPYARYLGPNSVELYLPTRS